MLFSSRDFNLEVLAVGTCRIRMAGMKKQPVTGEQVPHPDYPRHAPNLKHYGLNNRYTSGNYEKQTVKRTVFI